MRLSEELEGVLPSLIGITLIILFISTCDQKMDENTKQDNLFKSKFQKGAVFTYGHNPFTRDTLKVLENKEGYVLFEDQEGETSSERLSSILWEKQSYHFIKPNR